MPCPCHQSVCPDCTTWGRWEGQGHYNELSSGKRAETRLWYTYKNTLAGFMVTCFCTIYLVSTMSTRTNSISRIKTHLPQKFNPLKFSVIQWIVVLWTWILPHEKYPPYSSTVYPGAAWSYATALQFSKALIYNNYRLPCWCTTYKLNSSLGSLYVEYWGR